LYLDKALFVLFLVGDGWAEAFGKDVTEALKFLGEKRFWFSLIGDIDFFDDKNGLGNS
jgi:hypothetical protein